MTQDASHSVDSIPRDATLVMALDAYRNRVWSGALLLAQEIDSPDVLVQSLQVVSLSQIGSSETAAKLAELKAAYEKSDVYPAKELAARVVYPSIPA